jgi:lipoyl(octanoyl) transferase
MDAMPTLLGPARFAHADGAAVEWVRSKGEQPYLQAVAAMEARAEAIADGTAKELVWLLEHPPLYTAGVSAKVADLIAPDRLPVFKAGRGGQFTYHGPGQRVAYVMLDLRARGRDTRVFVGALEAWLIAALERLGVVGETRCGRVGVWVRRPGAPEREDKIAAIGVKLRRWVSFHGVSLNVKPDMSHFSGIVPCGVTDHGVTSLEQLGVEASMPQADAALASAFEAVFGSMVWTDCPIPD